jgi:hypothetical protein
MANVAYFQVAVDALLRFLRIKGGQGPNELSLTVVPSLDVTEFYGSESTQAMQETSAPGTFPIQYASPGSMTPRRYLALSAGVTIGAAVGTYVTIAVGYRMQPGDAPIFLDQWTHQPPVVGGVYRACAIVRGLTLPAGAFPIVRVDSNSAGADHIATLEYSFQRLDGLP